MYRESQMAWFVKIITFEQCLDLRNINWIFYCMLKWLAYQNETEATLGEIGIGRKNRQENVCNQYVCDSGASKWYVGSRHIIQLT